MLQMSVVGTPAEESTGGKIDMIKASALQGINATLMAHPFPFNIPKPFKFAFSSYVLGVASFIILCDIQYFHSESGKLLLLCGNSSICHLLLL